MTHLDTFDLRPDHSEIQGPVTGIKTKVPGTHVTNQLPGLAERMDLVAQIRSMTHTQGNHGQGNDGQGNDGQGKYHVRMGYGMGSRDVAHPAIGSWTTKQAPINPAMPSYIRVGDLGGHPCQRILLGCPRPTADFQCEVGVTK